MALLTPQEDSSLKVFTGRKKIFTDYDEVNDGNILAVVEQGYLDHAVNRSDIIYLYKYFKGDQPILYKVKEVRPEINEKIVINMANEIVAFEVGWLVGKPIQYISSIAGKKVSDEIAMLNDMMRNSGKITKDRSLVEWQMIAGTGYRLVLPKKKPGEKVPWEFYTLDPRNAFVIYANDYTQRPLVGVSYKIDINGNVTLTAYTEERIYTINKGTNEFVAEINPLGWIPIIEYPANSARIGAFEVVLTMLNALNELDSNRLDSVKQFVESLLVVYNADFEDPENTTANSIRQAGMVQLRSTGDVQADIKIISEKLDQTNTETLKQSLLQMIREIVGMPSQGSGNQSDANSTNGAIVLKNGWQGAETRAEAFEAQFFEPERTFLQIVSAIARDANALDFDPDDVDIRFTRRNYEDLLVKSQTLTSLLATDFVHPRLAFEASGLFVDSEGAFQESEAYYEEKQRELDAVGRTEQSQNEDNGDPAGLPNRGENEEEVPG